MDSSAVHHHYGEGASGAYRSSGPDRYRRGQYRSDNYAPRSAGPYDRPPAHRPRETKPRRLEDVFESAELLHPDQFARYAEMDGKGSEDAYRSYVRRHRRAALERFFAQHKDDAWFAERYGAFSAEAYAQQTRDAARARSDELRDAYRAGNFAHLCLQDGDDLCVGEERPGDARAVATVRAFPVSMTLPDRLLHAIAKPPATIALSNISPAVTSQQLVQMVRECSEQQPPLAVEESLPIPEKGFCRLGWAVFDDSADLAAIAARIESKTIYCSAQRSFSWTFRLADASLSAPRRLPVDAANARRLVEALDEAAGIVSWLFDCEHAGAEQALDLAVLYLRRVHYVCYYSAVAAQGPHDLVRLAGDLVIRSPSTLASSEHEAQDREVQNGKEAQKEMQVESEMKTEMKVETEMETRAEASGEKDEKRRIEEKEQDRRDGQTSSPEVEAFDAATADLLDRCIFRCEGLGEDQMLEKHVAKVDEGRYRCVHCSKLFKGVDFVVKHLRLKHEDVTKAAILETAAINALFARPPLCALLTVVVRRRSPSQSTDRPPREQPRSDFRPRDVPRPRRQPLPPPPPKDAPHDPRRMRQYVDWDAPAKGDVEISYD